MGEISFACAMGGGNVSVGTDEVLHEMSIKFSASKRLKKWSNQTFEKFSIRGIKSSPKDF